MQTCTGGMGTAVLYWNAVEHPVTPLPWRQRAQSDFGMARPAGGFGEPQPTAWLCFFPSNP